MNMNCSDFQTLLNREPGCTEADFLQHAHDCKDCHESYEQAMAFEAALLDAMEIDIPDDLTERVLDKVHHQQSEPQGTYRFALAASFMLLFVLAGWMGFHWGGDVAYAESLPQVVVQHIEKEIDHLHDHQQMSEDSVARLFSDFGAVMHTGIGEVSFAESCWIRHQRGMHLIIREGSSPVTLMFMPGEMIAEIQRFEWGQSMGLIIPTHYGSLAIVAPSRELVRQMHQRLNDALMWSI